MKNIQIPIEKEGITLLIQNIHVKEQLNQHT